MKKYFYIGIAVIIIGLISSLAILISQNKKLNREIDKATVNIKAFASENSKLKENNRVYELTVNQLEYFNDSLMMAMDSVRKELRVKDKNLKHLQYMLTHTSKTDTIYFRDTLIKKETARIDTTIRPDKWYSLDINIIYPNKLSVTPTFVSEKYIVTSIKKEAIKPPRKTKFGRFFQKKHKVLTVDVIENSPYITTDKQRFIEIIK